MSKDINRVVLVGRLTKDAELKAVGQTSLAEFSLASSYRIKKGDQWQEATSFFECDLWGRGAEALAKHLVKGKQVAITGELRQDRWEQDGQKRSKVKIVCDEIQLLSSSAGHSQEQGCLSLPPGEEIPF